ncbi:GbsR/MarR family transcriptional regulator [Halovenus halobia]|uniref:GbsR/MarR family transcriptional regulator n=1 Tax=Halovenus halobia TaxID=3396622 RepID=UPI003F5672E9
MDESQAPSAEIDAAREEVIEAMERTAEIYGLSRSYGRLYGLLFFADEPMSLDTLVEESGYAKSTVSTAMSDLKRLYLVRRRSIPGEGKKAFYEAERDLWTVFQEFLDREVRREIETMLRSLERAEQQLEAADSDQAERDLKKVRTLRSLYDRSQRLVGLLTSSSVDRLAGLLDRFQRE